MLAEIDLLKLCERARLISELRAEGIHVALPVEESDIAMLASLGASVGSHPCRWVPIQVIALDTSAEGMSRCLEMSETSELIVAVTMQSSGPRGVRTYALTTAELRIVRPHTESTAPLADMKDAIEPYAIASGHWRQKLITTIGLAPGS